MDTVSQTAQPQSPPAGKPSWQRRHWVHIVGASVISWFIGVAMAAGTATQPVENTAEVAPAPTVTPTAGPEPAPTVTVTATAPTVTVTANPKAAAPKPKPAAPRRLSDKGWVLASYSYKNDGLGDFGGTARITNTNDEALTATFTLTLFQFGRQVASLQGAVNDVAAGKTVTVDLISTDKYRSGEYTIDFQANVSF